MHSKFKLITSSSVERFEERLRTFAAGLGSDDVIVSIEFSTAALSTTSVEYSALIHLRSTEPW